MEDDLTLYIARDRLFNSLLLHTKEPKYKNKVYVSKGVCFDPSPSLLEKYKDLTTDDKPIKLIFCIKEE